MQSKRNRRIANFKYSHSIKAREAALRRRHGPLAVDLWIKFFAKQKGFCPGCGKHQCEFEKKLSLDHDHETNEFRGLLCSNCNLIVGSSEKHIQTLKNLVKYLEDFYKQK